MQLEAPVRVYRVADLWELSHDPAYTDMRLELVEGELRIMSPAGGEHGGHSSKFDRRVGNFVEDHDLGFTTGAETGYILYENPDPNGKDTVRAPDVGFVAKARLPDGLPTGYIPLAPDLVVEIISPTDRAGDIQERLDDYLKYGVRLMWFVYPKRKVVWVYTPTSSTMKRMGDTIDGGDVLPGFALPLADVFKDDEP
jgi:Uma2 family endonuclease